MVDGLGREKQALGDLRVAEAVRHEAQDLSLARGEIRGVAKRGRPRTARNAAHSFAAEPARHDGRGGPSPQLLEDGQSRAEVSLVRR